MYISTHPSPEVEIFQVKIHYPAGDRTPDLLNQRQTCYHLSQRGELLCCQCFIFVKLTDFNFMIYEFVNRLMVKLIVVMKIQPSVCLDDWGKPRKNPVRLVGTGIRTRDLPNASLVRYHGATSLGKVSDCCFYLTKIYSHRYRCPATKKKSRLHNIYKQLLIEMLLIKYNVYCIF